MVNLIGEWGVTGPENTSGDWWQSAMSGVNRAVAGIGAIQENLGAAVGQEGIRLTGSAARQKYNQLAQDRIDEMSTRGRATLEGEITMDNFWDSVFLKGVNMAGPMVGMAGATALGGLVGGPPGAVSAAIIANTGMNVGDVMNTTSTAIDSMSDEELLKEPSLFTKFHNGVSMEDIRRDLKLEIGTEAAAPTAAVSALTAPISAETGFGLWASKLFRPTLGTSFLGAKAKGLAVGAGLEAGGEVAEEVAQAGGINIAREGYENLIPEQDVGRAAKEAAIMGGITGGPIGALVAKRARTQDEINAEAIDTSGVEIVPEGTLDPTTAAATQSTAAPTPETVDLRPAFNQGTLTTGTRPGVMVGVRPPNVPSNVTLEDAPFEQAQEFLAQYGYTPEDLTGMDPMLRAELDERFNETYIPDRLATSQERYNNMDPAVHAAIVAANVPPGPPVSGGATEQVPNVTPVETATVAGEEGIPTTQASVAPNIFLPDRYPRARDVEPREPEPATISQGTTAEQFAIPEFPATEEQMAAGRGPLVLPSDVSRQTLDLFREEFERREAAARNAEFIREERLRAQQKAEGTYDQGYAKTSQETQIKRAQDEDIARVLFAGSEPISGDVDTAKEQLNAIVKEANKYNVKIPKRIRKGMSNEMVWLGTIFKTLQELDANRNTSALPILVADEELARNNDWEPMRGKYGRKQIADAPYSEALGADPAALDDPSLQVLEGGETRGEQAAAYRGGTYGKGTTRLTDNRTDEAKKKQKDVRHITDLSEQEQEQASAGMARVEARPTVKVGDEFYPVRPKSLTERVKAVQRAIGDRVARVEGNKLEKERLANQKRYAEERRRKEFEAAGKEYVPLPEEPDYEKPTRKPTKLQDISARVQKAAERERAKKKATAQRTRKARAGLTELVLRKAALLKQVNAALKATPTNSRTTLYRAGLAEAKAQLTKAGSALGEKGRDIDAARDAIERADDIVQSMTNESYEKPRLYGKKPKSTAVAVREGTTEPATTEKKGKRNRVRQRGRDNTMEAEPEALEDRRSRVIAVSQKRSINRATLPFKKAVKRIAERSGRSVPTVRTSEGKPSKGMAARLPAIWRYINSALAATAIDEHGEADSHIMDIADDLEFLIRNGDGSELVINAYLIARNIIRDTTTVNKDPAITRLIKALLLIDPNPPRFQTLQDFADELDEAFDDRPLREFPQEQIRGEPSKLAYKREQPRRRKYGRILPDLSKSEEQFTLPGIPQEHVSREVREGETGYESGDMGPYRATSIAMSDKGVLSLDGRRIVTRRMTIRDAVRQVASANYISENLSRQIFNEAIRLNPDMRVQILSDADMDTAFRAEENRRNNGVFHIKSGVIFIRESVWKTEDAKYTLAHEVVHALTEKALANDTELRANMESLLAEVRDQLKGDSYYGMRDIHELLAELADPLFVLKLKQLSVSDKLAQELGLANWKPTNGWEAVIAFIAKVLNKLGIDFYGSDLSALDALVSQFQRATESVEPRAKTKRDPEFRALSVDKDLEPANAVVLAKNLMASTSLNTKGSIDRGLMSIRTNDSLMRALEEYYPGLARKVHNLSMNRYVRAQEYEAKDVAIQQERLKLYEKYKDKTIDGSPVPVFYEDLLSDQNNRNINAAIPLEDNDWLGEGNIQKLHYPELKGRYNKLVKVAPDLASYMDKEWKFYYNQHKLISDTTIRNIVMALSKIEDISPERALEVGRRIVEGEGQVDDLKVLDTPTIHRLQTTPELRLRKGVYYPQRRYGDWVVNARVKVDAPKWKDVVRHEDMDGVVYDFFGPDEDAAYAAAKQYAAYNSAGKLREEYSTNPAIVFVGPKGELRKEDGSFWKAKDRPEGAQKRFRVHIQDRHTEFFGRESDAKSAVEQLSKDKYYAEVKDYTRKLGEPYPAAATVSSRQMEELMKQMDRHNALAGMDPKQRAITMRSIQEALHGITPGTSISKSRMIRRHVQGASKDAGRAMHSASVQVSNYVAAAETAPKMDKAIRELREAMRNDYRSGGRGVALGNELIGRQWAQNGMHENTSPTVNFLTSLVFIDKLVSVAYSVINMMQLQTNTAPRLAAASNPIRAQKALAKAMSDVHYGKQLKGGMRDTIKAMTARLEKSTDLVDYIIKGSKVSAEERAMLKEAVARGTLNADAGFEAQQIVRTGKVTGMLSYVENVGRQMPRAIDAAGRAVSLLASYRIARENGMGHDAAVDFAQDVTDETQFNYSPVNAPPMYNTGWGRVALQFTKYPLAMYQFFGAHIARAVKGDKESMAALGLTMAMYTLFSGVLGGGPWEPLRAVVTALNGMGIIDWDWNYIESTVREVAADMVGETVGEALTRGLPRLLDIDVSTRITLSQMLLPEPQGDIQEPGGLFNYVAAFTLGPSGGFLRDVPSGINDMRNGHWLNAASKLIPVKVLSDAAKGIAGASEGKRTRAGDVITTYNVPEILIQAAGFTPGSAAEAMEFRQSVYSARTYKQKQRERILMGFWDTPTAQRVRPAFVRQYRDLFRNYNEGLPRDRWLSFEAARNYAKDKDRRFSKSKAGVSRASDTDYLIDQYEGVYR